MASSLRIEKLNKLIRQELAQIINKEISFEPNVLVTLTKAQVHSNLSLVEVFITTLPEEDLVSALSTLRDSIFELQQILNKRLRMRPVPKIVFKADEGQIKAEQVYRLMNK